VRAVGIRFRFRDALRLGFLGYLFNFVSLGSVGGDLFKAVFIAREQPGRRAEAAATVVLDRLVGLYGLFVVAAVASLWAGLYAESEARVRVVALVSIWSAGLGAAGIGLLLVPGVLGERAEAWAARLPVVGATARQLVGALRLYRARFPVVLAAIGMSLGVHALFSVAFYLISQALPGAGPSLADHFVAVPLSLLASALPLPMAGLGAFEGALDFLYYYLGAAGGTRLGQGLVVAICYRAMTVLVALVGLVYYLASRRAVAAALREAAEEEKGVEERESGRVGG
jgi:uncharacterized membrane protein YbhN (UPF0104 family)